MIQKSSGKIRHFRKSVPISLPYYTTGAEFVPILLPYTTIVKKNCYIYMVVKNTKFPKFPKYIYMVVRLFA